MSVISKFLDALFGPEVYCDHGKTGRDGVCKDCCNDLYGSSDEDYAEVIDFGELRDSI